MCRSSLFTKKTCALTEICCVSLVVIFPNLIWYWRHIIKQMFHAFLFNIQLRFASLNINYHW